MDFHVRKPGSWSSMPLFKKLEIYQSQLSKKYAPYVDKLRAKEIVKEMAKDDISVAKVVRILEGPTDFKESDIHPDHIIKATHGCGWNISMTNKTSVSEVHALLKKWNRPYRHTVEMQYNYIPPRFFIEEKINDICLGITDTAITFMFRCIHGEPVTIGIRCGKSQNNYDLNWNMIKKQEHTYILEKPSYLPRMIALAKKLSQPFEFVRIDVYIDKDENIYFSEFTFSPSGGAMFFPLDIEKKLGKLWL